MNRKLTILVIGIFFVAFIVGVIFKAPPTFPLITDYECSNAPSFKISDNIKEGQDQAEFCSQQCLEQNLEFSSSTCIDRKLVCYCTEGKIEKPNLEEVNNPTLEEIKKAANANGGLDASRGNITLEDYKKIISETNKTAR